MSWYVTRYQRLVDLAQQELSKLADILIAIENEAGKVAATKDNKKHYCEWLQSIEIINTEYIAGLPTYRFTIEERTKVEKELVKVDRQIRDYQTIIDSNVKQRNVYKKELKDLLSKYG